MSKKIVSFILAICLALSTCVFVSFSEESDKKYVALTFDDGPNDTYFTDTLDLLWKYDALATFFVVGQNIAKYPDELNRVLDEGHEIGLHSYSHTNYTNYTIEQVNADIDKCQSAIYDATKTYSSILRLPSLSMPSYFVQRQINYPLIGAKFSSSANVLSGTVADGDIILIHNGIGSANVASDMQNLEAVLQKLTNEGFEFLTVSQLFEKKGVTPVKGTKQYSNVSAPATTSGATTTAATTGQMGEDGMLINFDDRAYAGYERQQDSTTTTTPAKYTSYSVVEETYTNADGESEPCSASGKAFKIAFPTGQTAKYRNASISLKDLAASGISPEATGIKFWAKSIGTTATLDCVGITTASKTKPSKCVTDLAITTEGKYYYLPYATLGVLSGDNMASYKYLTIYTDLYDMNGKTVYIDDISLYGLGEPVTTTTHYTQTFATSSRTTTRPLQSISASTTSATSTASTSTTSTTSTSATSTSTTSTSATSTSTTSTSATSTSSSASAPSECVSLSASQVKFVNCKYFSGTIVSGSSESGYLAKMQGGAFNATDKFFGFTFDKTVFDNNPIKFEFTLKTDGANYGGKYSWFSNSSYTSLQATPAVSSTTARVNTGYKSISTTGTTFTYDLTSETFLPVVQNQFNYFYLCASRVNSSVTAMYLVDFKVYYKTGYNVTIDGESVALEGDSLTFPNTADAYISGESLYLAGETVQITQDTDFVSYDLGLSMQKGAGLRLNQVNGIRFCTNIDADVVASIEKAGALLQMGTLIAPKDNITDGLTFDMANAFLDVQFNSSTYYSENGFTGIAGTIAYVKDENANKEFVGRGYVKITLGGETKTVYASYFEDELENNSRTIASLAKLLVEDTDAYDLLTDTHKQIVDRYYKLYSA